MRYIGPPIQREPSVKTLRLIWQSFLNIIYLSLDRENELSSFIKDKQCGDVILTY